MIASKDRFFREINNSLMNYIRIQSRKRESFEIAVITSLTGIWAKGGYNTKRGYDIWAKKVNSQGGIKVGNRRYPVRLIYFDDESDPEVGRKIIRDLLATEDIDFIFGPYSSAVTLAIAPVIERAKIPHITGSAEADEILEYEFEWTFGVLLGNTSSVRAPLKILRKLTPSIKTVAVIGGDDIFSRSMVEAFKNASLELGFKLKHYEIFPVRLKDLSPLIRKVKRRSPDALIVGGHVDNLINAVRTSKSLGFSPKAYVMHYGVASQDFVNALGGDAKHILGISQWSPKANYKGPIFGTAKEFNNLFIAVYDRDPDQIEAGCAATGSIFQQIIEKVGVTPPLGAKEKRILRDQLREREFETFFGPISFQKR